MHSPFDELMGTRLTEATPDRAVATLDVSDTLHQPGGLVHGGAYCSLVELTASMGATAWLDNDHVAVGLSNHTEFLRAVRGGRLRAEATPVQRGRRLQVWEVAVTDEHDRLVAQGTVRLANVATRPEPSGAA